MATEPQPNVPILKIAWARYAQLDSLSEKRDKPFFRWRRWIAILGVLAALFAVITQVYSEYMPATLSLVLKILLIATPVLAIAVQDFMLSPLVLLIGLIILIWINFQQKQVERAQINEDAEAVALQIRSLMSVDHSLLNALMKVKLPVGVMNHAIEQVASRLRMHQPPAQAAQALKGLPGNVTSRLSALIANKAFSSIKFTISSL